MGVFGGGSWGGDAVRGFAVAACRAGGVGGDVGGLGHEWVGHWFGWCSCVGWIVVVARESRWIRLGVLEGVAV